MYDFRMIYGGVIVYNKESAMVIISKTIDGYGYTDSEGYHDEGYATSLQCLQAVIEGLTAGAIIPIEKY